MFHVKQVQTPKTGLENRCLGISIVTPQGGVAERFKAPVLKTGEVSKTSVGSNPTPTANLASDRRDRLDTTDARAAGTPRHRAEKKGGVTPALFAGAVATSRRAASR